MALWRLQALVRMARNTGRSLLRALIGAAAISLCGASTAPPSLEESYRIARAAYDRGDSVAALSALDAALARARDRNDEAAWRLRVLRALTLISFGDHTKVLAAAEPELPRQLHRSDIAVDRYRALAIASYQLSRHDKAAQYIDMARRLAAEAHPRLLPQVLFTRASMKQIFDARTRERDAREALRGATRAGDVKVQTQSLGTLSLIAASQERYDEAIDFGQKTLQLALAQSNESLVQRTEGNLGWFYKELGDRESAEEHLRKAVAMATKLRADDNRVVFLLQLGDSELARGDLRNARLHFSEAYEHAQKLNSKQRGNALLSVAEVEFLAGDLSSARQRNEAALRLNEEAQDRAGVQRSRILEARMALAERRLEEARAILQAVAGEAVTRSVQWEAESWLAQVHAARADANAADEHFRAAIAAIDEARRDVRSSELRISVPELATTLYDAYIDFLVRQGRVVDALRVAELNRARTLAEGLHLDRTRRLEPESIAREANIVALSYRLGRARSFLWAITPAGVELFTLPPAATIENAVEKYQQTFATSRGTLEASGALGAELYEMLVAPAANVLRGVSRLAIIPDGRLAAFNFETLVVPSPRRYWIEDVTIQVAPSLQLVSRRRAVTHGPMLLIANSSPPDRAYPPLLYAGEEMRRIGAHFRDVTTLSGAQATPRAYLASAPQTYTFLHFVAHGVATRQRPLDSAIILASDGERYKLYARDILAGRLSARLVTISSCLGAGGRTYRSEGLVGLAWAFLSAGADEVIAALWEVNDRATVDLMDAMYAAIKSGHDPVDALRIAKLKLVRSGTVYRKPFYWAPFLVYSGS